MKVQNPLCKLCVWKLNGHIAYIWGDGKGSIDIIVENTDVITMNEFERLANRTAAKSPLRSLFNYR